MIYLQFKRQLVGGVYRAPSTCAQSVNRSVFVLLISHFSTFSFYFSTTFFAILSLDLLSFFYNFSAPPPRCHSAGSMRCRTKQLSLSSILFRIYKRHARSQLYFDTCYVYITYCCTTYVCTYAPICGKHIACNTRALYEKFLDASV